MSSCVLTPCNTSIYDSGIFWIFPYHWYSEPIYSHSTLPKPPSNLSATAHQLNFSSNNHLYLYSLNYQSWIQPPHRYNFVCKWHYSWFAIFVLEFLITPVWDCSFCLLFISFQRTRYLQWWRCRFPFRFRQFWSTWQFLHLAFPVMFWV